MGVQERSLRHQPGVFDHDRIAAIIAQRQDLQNAVAAVDAPGPLRRANQLLSTSIRASLDADFAIQAWLTAWYEQDVNRYESSWQEHERATARASAAKRDFVAEYDKVRRQVLKLGPAPAGDRY